MPASFPAHGRKEATMPHEVGPDYAAYDQVTPLGDLSGRGIIRQSA